MSTGSMPGDGVSDAGPLAELEEERRFLLASLSDLDRELDAGDVDAADYAALRDGYTRRAAEVLRSIGAGRSVVAPKPARRLGRKVVAVAVVVAIGVGLGLLVARFAAPRGSNDTITGGTDSDRIAALLTEGRSAMSTFDYNSAIDNYRAVLEIDTANVEARAYLGWVLANAAQQLAGEAKLTTLAAGKQGLVDAIDIDPGYADPYCLLAIVAARFEDDLGTAQIRRGECLGRKPSSEMQDLITFLVEPLTNPTASTTTGG